MKARELTKGQYFLLENYANFAFRCEEVEDTRAHVKQIHRTGSGIVWGYIDLDEDVTPATIDEVAEHFNQANARAEA